MIDVDVLPFDTSWLSEPTTGVHQFGGGSAPRTDPYVRLSRIRLPPRVFDGEHAVCAPAPVTSLPGTEPGTCYADPHSPWSPPFAPPTPQQIALPCSPASQLLRRGLTSHVRASPATAPRLPDADLGGILPSVEREFSQVPTCSFHA